MSNIQPSDSGRFKVLDFAVKKGLREAAEALSEIRDKELWRSGGHKSFKDYCESIGRSYPWAWQQIKNGKPAISLPQRVKTLPVRNSPETNSSPAIQAPQRRSIVPVAKDETGIDIPPEVQEFWNRNGEATVLLGMISKVRVALENGQGEDDPLYRFVDFTACIAKLRSIYEEVQCAKSFAVCPDCNGVMPEDCTTCRRRGTLPKFFWGMIDEKKKEMRNNL